MKLKSLDIIGLGFHGILLVVLKINACFVYVSCRKYMVTLSNRHTIDKMMMHATD